MIYNLYNLQVYPTDYLQCCSRFVEHPVYASVDASWLRVTVAVNICT